MVNMDVLSRAMTVSIPSLEEILDEIPGAYKVHHIEVMEHERYRRGQGRPQTIVNIKGRLRRKGKSVTGAAVNGR